jgi:hypothetical protein
VTDATGVKRTVPADDAVAHDTRESAGPPQEKQMAPRELQRLADASENDAAQRYLRRQVLAGIVEDAMRRADAMSRLDATLRVALGRRAA